MSYAGSLGCRPLSNYDNAGILPLCIYIADQLTEHMVYWFSANPCVDRKCMTAWRQAWHERFLSGTTQGLPRCTDQIGAELRQYLLTWVAVALAYIAGICCAVGLKALGPNIGPLNTLCTTAPLVFLAAATRCATWKDDSTFSKTLGHWLLYLKEEPKPPWVMQSPVGTQTFREVTLYVVAVLLGIALLLLAEGRLTEGTWDSTGLGKARRLGCRDVDIRHICGADSIDTHLFPGVAPCRVQLSPSA